MKRWTAFVTYRKTDDQDDSIVLEFEDVGELDAILESRMISHFNLVGKVELQYNGHMGVPISMAQCFVDGDFEPVGAFH